MKNQREKKITHLLKTVSVAVVLVIKNSPANAEDVRDGVLIPGSGRYSGEGHGNLLHYSCLENPTYRAVWQARVHRVTKSQTQLK